MRPRPASFNGSKYEWDKIIGRSRPTGRPKLNKLRPKHKMIIALHLQGYMNYEIANFVGFDEQHVSNVIMDPLAQEIINQHHASVDMKLQALMPMTVEVLRDALESPDMNVRLKAADKVMKNQGKYGDDGASNNGGTAEDVIARALERLADGHANLINHVTGAGDSMRRVIDHQAPLALTDSSGTDMHDRFPDGSKSSGTDLTWTDPSDDKGEPAGPNGNFDDTQHEDW